MPRFEPHELNGVRARQTDDPLFINSTAIGWLSVLDNDLAEVDLFPAAVELSEQTEDEWLSAGPLLPHSPPTLTTFLFVNLIFCLPTRS